MIPVFQDSFTFGEGTCVWACVSSIFGEDGAKFPKYPPATQEWFDWTKRYRPWLTYNNISLAYDYDLVDGPGIPCTDGPTAMKRWTYKVRDEWEAPDASATEGYWIAAITSPGLKRPPEDPYYPLPALHAVVMRGRECVHDPHPEYELNPHPAVQGISWWAFNEDYIKKLCERSTDDARGVELDASSHELHV